MCLPLLQVSLCAELFNEMLVRDFGFCIYKAMLACPDKAQEGGKRDDDRKKGSDKRNESKKKEDKKSEKDSVDQHDKVTVEVKKEANKDKDVDVEDKNLPEVSPYSSLFATVIQNCLTCFPVCHVFNPIARL